MSGKQRSIRKKIVSFDEEEEEGSGAVPPASVKAAQVQREKERKRTDAKPKLSFDEDLDAGDGSLASKKKGSKPSRPSLRAPLPAKAAEPSSIAAPSTQVSAAGVVMQLLAWQQGPYQHIFADQAASRRVTAEGQRTYSPHSFQVKASTL